MDWESRQRRRERRLAAVERAWLRGPEDPAYRWFLAAWAGAVAARLTLLEAQQPGWVVPNLALVVAAVGLLRWGGRAFWALSALALAAPLLFLGDWLSQSVVMLVIATGGLLLTRGPAQALGRDPEEPERSGVSAAPACARGVVIATYAVAAFHKLNRDFFDPAVSCAVDTWRQLDGMVEAFALPTPPGVGLAVFAVALEVAVAVLLWRRPRLGIAAGLVFHLPLTLVLAPAFAFVMLPGYVASLDEGARRALAATARRRWRLLVGAALVGTLTVSLLDGELPLWDMALKEAALFGLLGLSLVTPWRTGWRPADPAPRPREGAVRLVRGALVALFVASTLTPYLGLRFQHSAAMLSNLRIDAGCWNHLVVPEAVRLRDPYVRVDEASVGGQVGPPFADTEALLREGLWSHAALVRMRRNWCRPEARPISLRGTWDGEPFVIADLCVEDAPLPGRLLPFGDYLGLQKGLTRACPQACLH
jgi:hypothetical protein